MANNTENSTEVTQMEPMLRDSETDGQLDRSYGQGSLPGNQGSIQRDQGQSSVTRVRANEARSSILRSQQQRLSTGSGTGQRSGQRNQNTGQVIDTRRLCERDTRFFAGLFFILIILQGIHSGYMSYLNKQSHKSLSCPTDAGGFIASQVLFPLLMVALSVPVCMWLAANAWDFCQGGIWEKLKKTNGGFVAFHVFTVLSTAVYIAYILFMMSRNFNAYMDLIGRDATCYCSDVSDPVLDTPDTLFHCRCMVAEEETPWDVATPDISLIDDEVLQRRGSNYSGNVAIQIYNSSEEVHFEAEMFIPSFKKLVYYLELCILTISLRILCWSWASEYCWRDMATVDVTVNQLRTFRNEILTHSLYCFFEGIDNYALFTDLMDHGRDLAIRRPFANWIMATLGIGTVLLHIVMPFAHLRLRKSDAPPINKFLAALCDTNNRSIAMKMVSVVLNVLMLLLRIVIFLHFGGIKGKRLSNLFMLFIIKEVYVINQKASEFGLEWWEKKRR